MNSQAIRRLDLTLLLIFDSALRHRKLTEVARELGLTQPAISHALARLREIFGDELLLRRPHGMEPTRRALELAPRIAEILGLARDAVEAPKRFDPAAAQRSFRVAGLDLEMAIIGPVIIDILSRKAPRTRLAFRALARADAVRGLEDGSIDLAFGHFLTTGNDLLIRPLYQESYLVALAAGHRLARRRKLTLDDYCDRLRHVLVSLDGAFSGTLDAALEAQGRRRQVIATLPAFLPALATVSRSDLAVTMPARLVRRFAEPFGLKAFVPPLPVRSFEIMMAWHRRDDADPALSWLRGEVAATLAAGPFNTST